MATTADFRNGMVIELDGDLYEIAYFQHVKPGKGGAFVRTKLKGVLKDEVIDKTFRAGERVEEVRLVRRPVQFSYKDRGLYHFMDLESYEMIPLDEEVVGREQLQYLKENLECEGLFHEGKLISVELPFFVELEVTRTDPGVKGDTATGGTKPATLETGAVVQVPLFIEEGDVVKVDRREDKYLERTATS